MNGKHPELAACFERLATLAETDREPVGVVLTAWPELPDAIRAGIVAMVRAATLSQPASLAQ